MSGTTKGGVSKGILWSAIERFSVYGLNFVLTIIIARVLSPEDYGLIAMLAIFMAISQSFIDGGFGNALIQKKDRNAADFSTVFYCNIMISTGVYALIYLFAPLIASFYEVPLLTDIARVIGLVLIINSFGIVQQAIITIELNFRKLAMASLTAVLISGTIGIYMAYSGYGVWTLVAQQLINNFLKVAILWGMSKWKPQLLFSGESFKRLFSFGSKLLLSSLLHTVYTNLYSLVIGKKFEAMELGYFSRAQNLAYFPSFHLTTTIERAVYPILCEKQNDLNELNERFLTYTRMSCYLIFPIMVGMAVLADPLVRVLLTENWIQMVPLLQIICIAMMWDPIMRLNHTVINARGRSDYFLYAEVLKKIMGVTILLASIPFGITIMCAGLIVYAFCDMGIIIYYNTKVTGIGWIRQAKIVAPILLLVFAMGLFVMGLNTLLKEISSILKLVIGTFAGAVFYFGVSYIFKMKELSIIIRLIKSKIRK